MDEISSLFFLQGDTFNIEAVCPYYLPECQWSFFWHREDGLAIVTGYEPDEDERNYWLCHCGHLETSGLHCTECGAKPPWGCDCGLCRPWEDDEYIEPVIEDDAYYIVETYEDECFDYEEEAQSGDHQ